MTQPTKEQIRAAAVAAADKALRHVERAQNELASACAELSRLTHGVPIWRATSKLTDRVHAFWYRVQSFRNSTRYSLDATNIEALARRLDQVKHEAERAARRPA